VSTESGMESPITPDTDSNRVESRKEMPARQDYRNLRHWLLGTILVLAFVLRFHIATDKGFWCDEMFDAHFIHESWSTTIERSQQIWSTPLHMLMVKLAWTLHPSELSIRLFDLSIALLGIYLFYRLVARFLGNKWLGLLGALMMTLSPFHIHYSIELRPFLPAMTFALLAALAFERAYTKRRWGQLAAFVVFGILGLYNMVSMAFVLAGCGAWMAWELFKQWRAGRRWPALLKSHAPFAAAYIIFAAVVFSMNLAPAIKGFGDPPPDNIFLALLGTAQTWLGGAYEDFSWERPVWPLFVAAALFLVGLVRLGRVRAPLMTFVILLTTIYVSIAFMRGVHYYSSRFFTVQYPFFLLVLLNGGLQVGQWLLAAVERINTRWLRKQWTGPALVAASFAAVLPAYYPGLKEFRIEGKRVAPSFRDDTRFLEMNVAESEPLYFSTGLNYPLYYFSIYFDTLQPQDPPPKMDTGKTPFWVYSLGEDLFKKHPELAALPYYKVRLDFKQGEANRGTAYYFYKGQLDEAEWLLRLKPAAALTDIMRQLLAKERYEEFTRYIGRADRVGEFDLQDMLREATEAYRRLASSGKPTQTVRDLMVALIRCIDSRQCYKDPDSGYVYVPARCVTAYVALGEGQKALELGNRYLKHYWKNSVMLFAMADAEQLAGNSRKALDYYRETIRRGDVTPDRYWVLSSVRPILKSHPELAKEYGDLIVYLEKNFMAYCDKIIKSGKLEQNKSWMPSAVSQLVQKYPEFEVQYADSVRQVRALGARP
jgi:tetratricopeptide (TPR) repeat protein